jgi:hypothetical protein
METSLFGASGCGRIGASFFAFSTFLRSRSAPHEVPGPALWKLLILLVADMITQNALQLRDQLSELRTLDVDRLEFLHRLLEFLVFGDVVFDSLVAVRQVLFIAGWPTLKRRSQSSGMMTVTATKRPSCSRLASA